MTLHEQQCTCAQLTSLYETMLRIRMFEEKVAELDETGEIKTPCHYCIGQEATATGVCASLNTEDYIFGAHRSHGHHLAKGGNLRELMAEIFCRRTGCSSGRGGSMHICDPKVGSMGTVPIVGATISIAVGAALAFRLREEARVAVAFFGDGATEEGTFHESLNLAGKNHLPVLFICENNLYSSHMGIFERRLKDNIPDSGKAHGIPNISVDGNDVVAVYQAASKAADRAKDGRGPTLVECRTFRWRGHVGPAWDYDVGVKRKDELQDWLRRDPLVRAADQLVALGLSRKKLHQIEENTRTQIADAVEFARQSPVPQVNELMDHVFWQTEGTATCVA